MNDSFYDIVLLEFMLLLDIIEVSARSNFLEYSTMSYKTCKSFF